MMLVNPWVLITAIIILFGVILYLAHRVWVEAENTAGLRMTNDRQRVEAANLRTETARALEELERERARHLDTADTLALVEDINRALLVTNRHYAEDEQARRDRAAARKQSRKGATA